MARLARRLHVEPLARVGRRPIVRAAVRRHHGRAGPGADVADRPVAADTRCRRRREVRVGPDEVGLERARPRPVQGIVPLHPEHHLRRVIELVGGEREAPVAGHVGLAGTVSRHRVMLRGVVDCQRDLQPLVGCTRRPAVELDVEAGENLAAGGGQFPEGAGLHRRSAQVEP